MTTRQVPWDRLDGWCRDELDEYWQLTLDSCKIAARALAGRSSRSAARSSRPQRRDLLIAAEARAARATHDGPVIAAGSTGSMPATAKLLATIAQLPHGAVVLPGLDTDLDDASWELIGGARLRTTAEPPASAIRSSPCTALLRASASRATRSRHWRAEPRGRERLASRGAAAGAATDAVARRLR